MHAREKMLRHGDVLIEALPYIKEHHDSIMVIKLGGHAIVSQKTLESVVRDIVLLRYIGVHPVLVHGGGPEITEKMKKMGKDPSFVAGLRITDDETLEIVRMVLVGNINTKITSLLVRNGAKAVGLNGKDGALIRARKKPPQRVIYEGKEHEVDLGWVGETEIINPEIVNTLIQSGYVPVIAPIAMDSEGNALNLNADTVAGDMAAALHAKRLLVLTDVPGILKDIDDPSTRISKVTVGELEEMAAQGIIREGMMPKALAAIVAVNAGVQAVHIIDGSREHSLLLELLTAGGIGTMVVPNP